MTETPGQTGDFKAQSMEELKPRELVKLLTEERDRGFGLVPLVGSGISFPSGIMTAGDFDEYFRFTMLLCLNRTHYPCVRIPKGREGDPVEYRCWSLREHGWPPRPQKDDATVAGGWLREVAGLLRSFIATPVEERTHKVDDTKFNDFWGADENPWKTSGTVKKGCKIPSDPEWNLHRIYQEAIGCLGDWRSTLIFLSRLVVKDLKENNRTVGQVLSLGPPDLDIIDSFNVHITYGFHPSLIHRLLAELSGPMRIRTVLTTNFDTLLEEAFQHVGNPLAVFDVHLSDRLPDAHLVRAQNSLIKLHGGQFGTRADHSLDERPKLEDQETFRNYLQYSLGGVPAIPSHLLILGYSGADRRIVELIKSVLRMDGRLGSKDDARVPRTRIFWVCFSSKDVRNAKILREACKNEGLELYYKQNKTAVSCFDVIQADSSILLYELYASVTLATPPHGLGEIYSHHVPPEARCAVGELESFQGEFNNISPDCTIRDEAALIGLNMNGWNKKTGKVVPYSATPHNDKYIVVERALGTVDWMGEHFRLSKRVWRRRCIWLELDDYLDVDHLRATLYQCIFSEIGMLWGKPAFSQLSDPPLKDMINHYRIIPSGWNLYFYARNMPGANASWCQGPMDFRQLQWGQQECEELDKLFTNLSDAGFHVYYMPFTPLCKEAWMKKFKDESPFREIVNQVVHTYRGIPKDQGLGLDRPESDKKIEEWINEAPGEKDGVKDTVKRRLRFIYAITLFRGSRHISALQSDGPLPCPSRFYLNQPNEPDNDAKRARLSEKWVEELCEKRVLRRKPGGFLWMHQDVREELREYLKDKSPKFFLAEEPGRELKALTSQIYYLIAEYYKRSFIASGHIELLFDALYYYAQALLTSHDLLPHEGIDNPTDHDTIRLYRHQARIIALLGILDILTTYRDHLVASMSHGRAAAVLEPDEFLLREGEKYDSESKMAGRVLAHAAASGRGLPPRRPRSSDHESWSEEEKELDFLCRLCDNVRLEMMRIRALLHRDVLACPSNTDKQVEKLRKESRAITNPQSGSVSRERDPFLESQNSAGLLADVFYGCDLAVRNCRSRNYTLGEEILRSLVERVGEKNDRNPGLPWKQLVDPQFLDPTLRQHHFVDDWLRDYPDQVQRILPMMRLLREVAYYHVQVCYILRLDHEDHCSERETRLRLACRALFNARRLGFFLHPGDLPSRLAENTAIYSIYGLCLGMLNRFSEARRRLTEALCLSGLKQVRPTYARALVELRQAEVSLLESVSISKNSTAGPEARILGSASRLNDAWDQLDRAERGLTQTTNSTFWWAKLYMLRLQVLEQSNLLEGKQGAGGLSFRTLADRRRMPRSILLSSTYQSAMMLAPSDPLRIAKIILTYRNAGGEWVKDEDRERFKVAYEEFGPLADSCQMWAIARRYCQKHYDEIYQRQN